MKHLHLNSNDYVHNTAQHNKQINSIHKVWRGYTTCNLLEKNHCISPFGLWISIKKIEVLHLQESWSGICSFKESKRCVNNFNGTKNCKNEMRHIILSMRTDVTQWEMKWLRTYLMSLFTWSITETKNSKNAEISDETFSLRKWSEECRNNKLHRRSLKWWEKTKFVT